MAITLEDLAARLDMLQREKARAEQKATAAEQKAAALEEEMRALRAALETPARGHHGAARRRNHAASAGLPPAPAGADQAGPVRTNRRRVLRTLLGVAAATVGAGAALEAETGRAAADGQPLATPDTPGTFSSNSSSTPAVTATGTNGASGIKVTVAADATGVSATTQRGLGVSGSSSSGTGVYGLSGRGDGVEGSSTSGNGVSGLSTSGNGVFGHSNSAYGGDFLGGLAPIHLYPSRVPGSPTSGDHQTGELYVDSTGVLWFCAGSGTPGTWKKVSLI
jgi:hypothetical protein